MGTDPDDTVHCEWCGARTGWRGADGEFVMVLCLNWDDYHDANAQFRLAQERVQRFGKQAPTAGEHR